MAFGRDQREVFDEIAEIYDRVRPTYPPDVVDHLIDCTSLSSRSSILEVGCGTGQLTRLLAARRLHITAVELGERMAQVARRNLASYPDVRVVRGNFETWEADDASCDLVCSAQAFHWVDPEIGYPKAHRLLRPEGWLALLWNLYPGGHTRLHDEIEEIYRAQAMEIASRWPADSLSSRIDRTIAEMSRSGCFAKPDVWQHSWSCTYSSAEYADLLRTFSDHRSLPGRHLEDLISRICEAIDRHGGRIERKQVSTLLMSRPI